VEALKKEEESYVDIPIIKSFASEEEMKIVLNKNFIRIKEDIKLIIKKESERLGLIDKK
jgi:ribonuclease HIII